MPPEGYLHVAGSAERPSAQKGDVTISTAIPAQSAPLAERANAPEVGSESEALLSLVTRSLNDDKAEELVVIDLAGKTSIADYMVIASGRSARQVGAMAEHVYEKLKHAGVSDLRMEGKQQSDWVLIDAGDVIVHIFRPEVRAFYNLEKMWAMPLIERNSRASA